MVNFIIPEYQGFCLFIFNCSKASQDVCVAQCRSFDDDGVIPGVGGGAGSAVGGVAAGAVGRLKE